MSWATAFQFACPLTLDWGPLDLLAHIFLLLRLERELDEDLLQFLVDVVDAQLLEAVVLEDFETAARQLAPPRGSGS
jgi:hypothetical protein